MFGDSSTVADVRLLLAKQQETSTSTSINAGNSDLYSTLGLEYLETTLINSLRYLMSAHTERTSETRDSVDVEAGIRMDAVEGRIGVNEDNLKLAESEDQIKQEMRTYDRRSEVIETATKPSLKASVNDNNVEECQCNCGERKTESEGLNILHLPVSTYYKVFKYLLMLSSLK